MVAYLLRLPLDIDIQKYTLNARALGLARHAYSVDPREIGVHSKYQSDKRSLLELS
jgi:hypothetical protein